MSGGWSSTTSKRPVMKPRAPAAMVITSSNVVDVCRIAPMVAVAEAARIARSATARRHRAGRLALSVFCMSGGPCPGQTCASGICMQSRSLSAPVAHVHPERPDPRDDALGHDAGRRPVVAPHPVRRRVGDEAARLLEREEDAAAAHLPLVAERVLGVG